MNEVINNFIPQLEVDRVRANMVWDKDTGKWVPKPSEKNTVLQKIMGIKIKIDLFLFFQGSLTVII